jgi:hypothetical protein
MLGTFIIGMLIVCTAVLFVAWAGDSLKSALEPAPVGGSSQGPKPGRARTNAPISVVSLGRKGRTPQSHEPAIVDLAVITLQDAIRRIAARTLEAPRTLGLAHFSRIERLMRIAVALADGRNGMPQVRFHGVPRIAGLTTPPETLSVNLSDLLAARASDHLGAALEGDPHALSGVEQEAERLLETEDIQVDCNA